MREKTAFRRVSGGFAALLSVIFLAPFCYVLLSSFWSQGTVSFLP